MTKLVNQDYEEFLLSVLWATDLNRSVLPYNV